MKVIAIVQVRVIIITKIARSTFRMITVIAIVLVRKVKRAYLVVIRVVIV